MIMLMTLKLRLEQFVLNVADANTRIMMDG